MGGYRSWLRGTAPTVALLTGAETALLYLLTAELAGGFESAPLGWGWLWALGMVAFFAPRALRESLPDRVHAAAMAGMIAATVLVAAWVADASGRAPWDLSWLADAARSLLAFDDRMILLLLAVLLVWWRQTQRLTPDSSAAEFLFGVGPFAVSALVMYGLAIWGIDGERIRDAALHVAAFFLLSLLALAYTQWLETPQRDAGGPALASWLGTSTLPIVGALVLTAVVSALIFGSGGPVMAAIQRVFATIAFVALAAVSAVLTFVAGIVAWIFAGLTSGSNRGPNNTRLPDLARNPTDPEQREILPRLVELPEWAGSLLGLLLVLLAVWALTRLRPGRDDAREAGVAKESVWKRPDLGEKLRALLRRRPARADDPLRALAADPAWRHTVEVRRVYRDVQHLYEREGQGRSPAQTPSEHATAHPSGPLAELAALYNQARYSTRPAPAELADRARALRRAVRDGLRGRG